MNKIHYVNVSVCKSNIKSKKDFYFGRVCKEGHVNERHILHEVKKRTAGIDIDIPIIEAVMKKMSEVVFDFLADGYDVDFFDMGTFSLATCGQLELKYGIEEYCAELKKALKRLGGEDECNNECEKEKAVGKCGNYDITEAIGKNVKFRMKFSPSKRMKEFCNDVKMRLAIKKKRAPSVKKVEFPISQSDESLPSFVQIKGDGLKVVGDSKKTGTYMEDLSSGVVKKIDKTAIIGNTPKNLLLMVKGGLKQGREYDIKVVTQYVLGGSSSVLRVGGCRFVYECPVLEDAESIVDEKNCLKSSVPRDLVHERQVKTKAREKDKAENERKKIA